MEPSYIAGVKYAWLLPKSSAQEAIALAQRYNISVPIAQAVLGRGYNTPDQISRYFFSAEEHAVAHPSLLKGAKIAVDRILRAIEKKEKILIFGDYDVDGITSSALMLLSLKKVGAEVNFFLPHRVRDGYGLSTKVVERAAQNGYSLIITVDNGITAFDAAERARDLGIDLIITDHHRPHEQLPPALAIVNPNQTDCAYPFKGFAGVGVSFKLMSLLYERLKQPLPAKIYELLLLGTIADVVPLIDENRFWVRYGLQKVREQESFSLKVLKQNGNVTRSLLSATDVGFAIAPQINALGRLEDPRQGVKFLIGDHFEETEQIGKVLFELNQMRKEIERGIFNQIVTEIEKKQIDLDKEYIIMAGSAQWPAGVIGLVASRLVGAYGRPAILFHMHNGKAKGSCRSIKEFNMFNALQSAHHLLDTFGGHSVAAGLALDQEKVPHLKAHLEELMAQQITPFDLKQKIALDGHLSLPEVNKKIVTDLQLMEPFGNENPIPVFTIEQVTLIQRPQLLKDAHVKCMIFADGVIKPLIFFNRPELFELLQKNYEQPFSVAAQVTENQWQGNTTIELIGIDVAFEKGNE